MNNSISKNAVCSGLFVPFLFCFSFLTWKAQQLLHFDTRADWEGLAKNLTSCLKSPSWIFLQVHFCLSLAIAQEGRTNNMANTFIIFTQESHAGIQTNRGLVWIIKTRQRKSACEIKELKSANFMSSPSFSVWKRHSGIFRLPAETRRVGR